MPQQSHLLQMRGLKQKSYKSYCNQTVSHLLQMRGLKQSERRFISGCDGVASFTDAWIETPIKRLSRVVLMVASFTDAWIETYFRSREQYLKTVASFTDAWIETGKK